MLLIRRALAEFVGTAFLVAIIVGSGVAATRLSPSDAGLELLENALITGGGLAALILALQPVSAAFNPVVTMIERVFGAISTRAAAALIVAQVTGGIAGAIVANLMFKLPAVSISSHMRSGAGLWLGEVVATLGLMLVIFGMTRAGRSGSVGIAVGAYIVAGYWFTSSTSFANPAVTIGRVFSNSFAGIAPGSVAMFIVMQLLGGAAAYLLIRCLYPGARKTVAEIVTAGARETVRAADRQVLA